MKKNWGICTMLVCITVMLILGACTSSPDNLLPTPDGIIDTESASLPDWVTKKPEIEDAVYFVGRGGGKDLTKAEKQVRAIIDAAQQLVDWHFTVSSQYDWAELSFKDETALFVWHEEFDSSITPISDDESFRYFLSIIYKMDFVGSWIDDNGDFLVVVKYNGDNTQDNGASEESDEGFNINEIKKALETYEEVKKIYTEFRGFKLDKTGFAEFNAEEAYEALKAAIEENSK